jgi:cell division protease FtsH
MTSGREYSDSTAQLLDEEISRILLEQEQRAHTLLTQHRKGLELVAEKLIEDETIDGATVGKLVQEALQSPVTEVPLNN